MAITLVIAYPTTASSSVNTKGAYTQGTASTPEEVCGMVISLNYFGSGTMSATFDIATGGAGAEVVRIADFHVSNGFYFTMSFSGSTSLIPIGIPAGTRIALRMQSSVASQEGLIEMHLIGGKNHSTTVDHWGTIASSLPQTVDCGAVASTPGAYVQLSASTPTTRNWVNIMLNSRRNDVPQTVAIECRLATGGAGAEVERTRVDWITANNGGNNASWSNLRYSAPLVIPAGTRVAVRGATSTTDATDRLFGCSAYGATAPNAAFFNGANDNNYTHTTNIADLTLALPTSSASNNTEGAFSQLVASTSQAYRGLYTTRVQQDDDRWVRWDIATGGAGAEVVRIPDIPYTTPQFGMMAPAALYPIGVPASTRLSVRMQSNLGSVGGVIFVLGIPAQGNTIPTLAAQVYGNGGANTTPLQLDAGGTINTKGSYHQLSASITNPITWLVYYQMAQNGAPQYCGFRVDIATGGAGAEVVRVPDMVCRQGTNSNYSPTTYCMPVPKMATGTRLAIRSSCETNDVTDRLLWVSVHGVDTDTSIKIPNANKGAGPGKGPGTQVFGGVNFVPWAWVNTFGGF